MLHLFAAFGAEAVVQANDTSTLRASPFLMFFQQKLGYAEGFDPHSIFDQADVISQPVSFVDMLNRGAWKR
jgi:hypothetical protein